VRAATLTAETAEIHNIRSYGYPYQLWTGLQGLDIPLHTHEAGFVDMWVCRGSEMSVRG